MPVNEAAMTNEQLDALLPCPFCGGEAQRDTLGPDEFGNEGGDVIECSTCGASSHVEFGRKEGLVSAWNRRTDTTLRARAEAAEADAEKLVEELKSVTAHMVGVESAYRKYARRNANIRPRAEIDPFYTTRVEDFRKAAVKATTALAAHNERMKE